MKWRAIYNLILAIVLMFISGLHFSQHHFILGWVALILGFGNGGMFLALIYENLDHSHNSSRPDAGGSSSFSPGERRCAAHDTKLDARRP